MSIRNKKMDTWKREWRRKKWGMIILWQSRFNPTKPLDCLWENRSAEIVLTSLYCNIGQNGGDGFRKIVPETRCKEDIKNWHGPCFVFVTWGIRWTTYMINCDIYVELHLLTSTIACCKPSLCQSVAFSLWILTRLSQFRCLVTRCAPKWVERHCCGCVSKDQAAHFLGVWVMLFG